MACNQLGVVFLAFFLSCAYGNFNEVNKDAALIESTCKKTDNFNLCVSSLKSDPRSSTVDVKGLGRIMYEKSTRTASDNIAGIRRLIPGATNPVLKRLLNLCVDRYNAAVGELQEGIRNLDQNALLEAVDQAGQAINEIRICDKAFSDNPSIPSLLKARNGLFTGQAAIGGQIVSSLIKKL